MTDKVYRALIVDDEPFMLEGLRLMIDWRSCGFELVGEADTAERAIVLFDELKPDIVISDIRMPGMIGTELAEIIHEKDPRVLTVLFSGYRDFKYAQSAIRANVFGYLLKPIDAFEVHKLLKEAHAALFERDKSLSDSSDGMREHVLRRLVYGDDSEEVLRQCALMLAIRETDRVMCISVEAPRGSLVGILPSDMSMFGLSPSVTCAIIKSDASTEYIASLFGALSPVPRVGAGSCGIGAEGFRESARQSLLALGAQFESVSGVRVYREYDASLARWLSVSKCDEIANAVNVRRKDELKTLLNKMRSECAAVRPSAFCLRIMAQNVMLSLKNGDALSKLVGCEITDVRKWLDDFGAALGGILENGSSDDPPEIVKQALSSIESGYAGELTLSDLSARLYINAAYLGQLIKKYTGDTFNHLLNARRMAEACRLLRQTRLSVREVADCVGIPDESYFAIRFKKHTGQTPLSYRSDARPEDSL